MNRFASLPLSLYLGSLYLGSLALFLFSVGCGGSTCPAGSVPMAGRCVRSDASTDAGPDAQADASPDASDGSMPDSGGGGSCAVACGASEACCDGSCVSLSSDATHCGSCATSCGSSEGCTSMDARATGGACQCDVGTACTSDADCLNGRTCIPEVNTGSNPEGLRGGGTTDTLFSGGYCSNGRPAPGLSVCDPAADTCGDCASCLAVDRGSIYACLQDCIVNPFDNGGCRPGYQCDPVSAACVDGCTTDAQCNRVRLADGSVATIDGGTGVCNTATHRCEHMRATDSHTGDACTDDFACPTNQQCIFGTEGSAGSVAWPDGYCTHTACEVAGFSCPGDAVCSGRSPDLTLDQARCLKPCTFMGESADDALRVGELGHGVECRVGYSCVWDGTSLAGTPGSGDCQPGNYNAVASANYGASCTQDSQCYSPYGLGRCFGEPGRPHFCTLLDCTAVPICGADACAAIAPDGSIEGCAKTCVAADECNANQGCVGGTGTGVCVNYCRANLDCRSGQSCVIATGESAGQCS